MPPLFELPIDLTGLAPGDTARALHRQLKTAVLDGRLLPGARLPPTRAAAAVFGVSRNTAAEVYARLFSEGLVTARQGSGTFVAEPIRAPRAPTPGGPSRGEDRRLNPFWLRPDVTRDIGFWREDLGRGAVRPDATTVDLRPALIDSRLFPFDLLRQSMARQLRRMETRPAVFKSPQGNQGNHHLRQGVAEHIGLTRAVACQAQDVLVTCGAQQAFDLLARVLVAPGQTVVAVENPGYPPLRVAFAAAGARVVGVEVDDEGLVVDALPADAGIVCVCPSHQFPLGMSMSARRRRELVAFARRRGAVIVEDDYDGEFRYDGAPLQALHSEAPDVVFYVGTFSKCMLPALRLGYLVAPDWAMPTLTAAKNGLDWHCSIPLQLGVASFIGDGHLARHVGRLRPLYAQRRQALVEALHGELGAWLAPIPSAYGMHVAATLREGVDAEAVSVALATHGVKLHGLARYYVGEPGPAGFVFGYGGADMAGVSRGLSLLRERLAEA